MDKRDALIQLVRLGIGHNSDSICADVNWREVEALAQRQGLSAIIVDGIERLPEVQRPPKGELLQMIGQVVQCYEYRYDLYRRAIVDLASFYREHNLKMMVLKGYSCSLNWPKPEHRPCGDIDIWLFGGQKKGDSLLKSERHIKIDNSQHQHTVFYWQDYMVENHYDFVNVYAHKSNVALEKVLKELGSDDSNFVDVCGEKIYFPSPNLHALFLVKHMASHFASSEISLRHVLDWAFFVEKHNKEIDWNWLVDVLENFHMKDFFNLINGVCVDDLGFPPEMFHNVQFLPELKEKVLADILDPAYGAAEPTSFIPRMVYKYRRWQGNAWKQKLCYDESRWSAFWYGVRNHLIKPSYF